ncbi:serine protease [Palleronia sp. LCG004]|uniref:serine protease n=1 Tax=Palleronia sp. LCG004 TaxID=3079304 RepID=UPI002943B8F6|nr:serine protease [Palleronia sp. LCG004]WOI57110.1 serine protease [Palleronia sp. LCG004]
MTGFLRAACVAFIAMTTSAGAQGAWVQVEAQPSEAEAIDAARRYALRLDEVNGFRIGNTRWYAIALGPFTEAEAAETRARLRAARLIPGDAFLSDGTSYRAQFWPDEAMPERVALEPRREAAPRGETRAEALRSERLLSASERRELQVALRGAGFYEGGIDGAFGRGTREAMQAWQAARGFDATGVMTIAERAALIEEYDTVLDGLGMRRVADDVAGIAIDMPTERVAFDRYAPPFARYVARDDGDAAQVLLISQRGDGATLRGLYAVMQTLEIVPEEGPREMRERDFTLVGRGDGIVSHTEARLDDGRIKGFTVVWPEGDEARRTRIVEEMRTSFAIDRDTVMDDDEAEPSEDQGIDLLAGLTIRRPDLLRSGFYVSQTGHVLTTADATAGCARVTLDRDIEARVVDSDADLGLSLLAPEQPLAPRSQATFLNAVPRLDAAVVLSGFSFDGALGAPSLTYGTLADLRGLDGEEGKRRLTLAARSGDAGGPVLDGSGAVLGMLLATDTAGGRTLPENVAFAADADALRKFLSENGISADLPAFAPTSRRQIEDHARDMTVLVGCWN